MVGGPDVISSGPGDKRRPGRALPVYPRLRAALARHPRLRAAFARHPRLRAALARHPRLRAALARHPRLRAALARHPQLRAAPFRMRALSRCPAWARLAAGAAAAALIAAGAIALLTGGQARPAGTGPGGAAAPAELPLPGPGESAQPSALLSGTPMLPQPPSRTLVLGGADIRLLSASGHFDAALGWPARVPRATGFRSLWQPSGVRQVDAVPGGFIALLGGNAAQGNLAAGDVLLVRLGPRGAATPRLIAQASYLAVAPDRREIWLERTGAGGRDLAWLVSDTGRRLSADVVLHRQVLLGATARGLLTQGPTGLGANLINPATGRSLALGVPSYALIDAVGADAVAWQPVSCGAPCHLHVTSLRGGAGTVITLPSRTADVGDPAAAAFSADGQRLALPMEAANREHKAIGTYVYVADVGSGRLTRLPGGPIPLSSPADGPVTVTMRWSGPDVWVLAADSAELQAGCWSGSGPLGVLAPLPGAADTFDVVAADAQAALPEPTGAAARASAASQGGDSRQHS
jgi:hypothetical protein